MFARIVLTNGSKSVKLYWLEHTGNDVYHGDSSGSVKYSYHGSGRIHAKMSDGVATGKEWQSPLSELQGWYALALLTLKNKSDWFEGEIASRALYEPERAKSKADTLLMIDTRNIPIGADVWIYIFLLEPGSFESLEEITITSHFGDLKRKQILLDTSVEPWVGATVSWGEGRPKRGHRLP